MRSSLALGIRGATGSKLLLSAATALVLAGCSSGADRLTASRNSQDEIYTASVPEEIRNIDRGGEDYARPLDQSSVTRKPLANARNYQSQQQAYTQPVYRQPIYQQPSYTQPPVVAAPQPQVAAAPSASMVAQGGEIRVEPGMTLFSIARANNVSVKDLARANNLQAPYAVRTGQILRVPGVAQARAPQLSPPATEAPAQAVASKAAGSHEVEPGDTLYSLGRKYGVSPRLIASLNGLSTDSTLSVGQKLRIPSGGSASTVVADNADVQEPAESNGATLNKTSEGVPPLPAAPVQTASQQKDDDRIQPSDEAAGPSTAIDPSLPGFRWPVKGKIISGYGSKPNGLRNEGINIAVPEGTSVRAAESGVVAYAGNELKGYGNLVLIRHEGGWVTAYAHNKELFVKRGDTVKRGDVVAKAGQTGSVSSPQVHFEIRKGATAMDPMRFLSNSTAAN